MIVDGMHAGAVTVREDATVARTAMIGGDLIVAGGVACEIDGMVNGNLRIGAGATVVNRGMVSGTVHNDGGTLSGTGMTGGTR